MAGVVARLAYMARAGLWRRGRLPRARLTTIVPGRGDRSFDASTDRSARGADEYDITICEYGARNPRSVLMQYLCP
jgi:hypothetical protein